MPVAAAGGSFLLLQQKVGGGVKPKVDVEVVVVCGCVALALWVRWSGVGGPGQSFDNGVVRVDHPILCGSTPRKECDDKGMGILVELPGIVDDASKLVVVMGLVVGDANALGKKARVVGKVECAG